MLRRDCSVLRRDCSYRDINRRRPPEPGRTQRPGTARPSPWEPAWCAGGACAGTLRRAGCQCAQRPLRAGCSAEDRAAGSSGVQAPRAGGQLIDRGQYDGHCDHPGQNKLSADRPHQAVNGHIRDEAGFARIKEVCLRIASVVWLGLGMLGCKCAESEAASATIQEVHWDYVQSHSSPHSETSHLDRCTRGEFRPDLSRGSA